MERDIIDRQLIAVLSEGLPIVARPYAAVAADLGTCEADIVERIKRLEAEGALSRFGVIVRHHEIGYRANAMVVWDIPDAAVGEIGEKLAALDYVTLCYRRPRRLPDWPYNLFCMIHGRDRKTVEALAEEAAAAAGAVDFPRSVLFSTRQFKQRGARYAKCATAGK